MLKRRGLNVEPCGFTAFQDNCWPLRTTLCFWDAKKFCKTNGSLPKVPFLGSLNTRPPCQTSNAFEMSKKTPGISSLSANELYISCVIGKIDLAISGYYQ